VEKKEFTLLYQKIYPLLFRYLYRLSKNEEASKDICQEVFMKLYSEINKGNKIEFIKSWLFKCATNNFLNKVKREQIVKFEEYTEANEYRDPQNPEEIFIKDENLKCIAYAINKLSPIEKQLIYLYQEDFSYAEIAMITGIKPNSVGKTLSRTIQKVTSRLHKTKSYELFR